MVSRVPVSSLLVLSFLLLLQVEVSQPCLCSILKNFKVSSFFQWILKNQSFAWQVVFKVDRFGIWLCPLAGATWQIWWLWPNVYLINLVTPNMGRTCQYSQLTDTIQSSKPRVTSVPFLQYIATSVKPELIPEPYPAFWGPYAQKNFEAPEIGQAF